MKSTQQIDTLEDRPDYLMSLSNDDGTTWTPIDTLEDLLEYLIAEGKTVALQKVRQMIEENEELDLDGLIMAIAGKENEDGTGQGT